MDYFDIVLAGYANENTKKHLTNYFTRKYKKAKNNHYTIEEFFDGCLSVLDEIEKQISISKMNRLKELETILYWKKNGMKGDADKPKTPTQKDLNEAEEIKKEIDSLTFEHFPFNLFSLKPQKYTGLIYYSHLEYIKLHLITAKKQLIEPQLKMHDNLKKNIDDIEEKINEKFSNNSDQPIQNDLKKQIEDYYKFFLEEDDNKKLQRLSDSDFEKFVDWLVYFYENDCETPSIDYPITNINTNVGLVRFSLMDFYKNVMALGIYTEALFDFYRHAFYPYRNDKTDTIKKNKVLREYRMIVRKTN
ncbi:hypothetical protein [uncultured Tenacibaculum sp.]|uniref:hypothetical protein n=1 Tax=uncultured Tenacibaculum sp. TaxID=174713 RepID=UPI002620ED18|nr:hypothetical protein [uncultured Tenacibaculum sp.]